MEARAQLPAKPPTRLNPLTATSVRQWWMSRPQKVVPTRPPTEYRPETVPVAAQ